MVPTYATQARERLANCVRNYATRCHNISHRWSAFCESFRILFKAHIRLNVQAIPDCVQTALHTLPVLDCDKIVLQFSGLGLSVGTVEYSSASGSTALLPYIRVSRLSGTQFRPQSTCSKGVLNPNRFHSKQLCPFAPSSTRLRFGVTSGQ